MRKTIALLAATLLAAAALERPAAADVSAGVFYDSLQPYGDWMETTDYGYVWHPHDVAANWRPYTHGSWAYTDAGWTFVSDDPYGWATYHYGRWANLEDTGWVWIPGQDWAPSWVSWRTGDKYIGWAPLPPEATFVADVGIQGWADSYYDIGPEAYSFVEMRQFGEPQLGTVIVQPAENVTIINETRNITNITYNNNAVFVRGPDFGTISRETAHPIRQLKLERDENVAFQGGRAEALRANVQGNTLRMPAPRVNLAEQGAAPKVTRTLGAARADHGWKGVAQADQVRAQLNKGVPKLPAGLPQQPKFEKANTAAAAARPSANEQRPGSTAATEALPGNNKAAQAEQRNGEKPGIPGRPANATSGREATAPTVGTPKEPSATENNAPATRKGEKPGERRGAGAEKNEPGLTPPNRNGAQTPEERGNKLNEGNEPGLPPPGRNGSPETRAREGKESRPEAGLENKKARNGETSVTPQETNKANAKENNAKEATAKERRPETEAEGKGARSAEPKAAIPEAEHEKAAPRNERPAPNAAERKPGPPAGPEAGRGEKKGDKPEGGSER